MNELLPEANSIEAFMKGLEILSEFMPQCMKSKFQFSAEHDILHVHVSTDVLREETEKGKILSSLGFHACKSTGYWSYYT